MWGVFWGTITVIKTTQKELFLIYIFLEFVMERKGEENASKYEPPFISCIVSGYTISKKL